MFSLDRILLTLSRSEIFRENQVKKKFILGKVRGQLLRCLRWYLKRKFQVKKGGLFWCTLLFVTGTVALTVFCLMYTYLSLIIFQHETSWEPAKLDHRKPVNKKEFKRYGNIAEKQHKTLHWTKFQLSEHLTMSCPLLPIIIPHFQFTNRANH